jgi:isopenicillin-N N-acyltransferase-like protein
MLTHVSREPLARDRGLAFGRAHPEAIHGTVVAYERLFREVHGLEASDVSAFGDQVAGRLSDLWPETVEEIAGIAAGAGIDETTLVAINARTELLAGAAPPECSAIGVLPERSGGTTLLAQNWDWHPDVRRSLMVWTIEEPDGRWLTTMTEAGILAKIGMNSRGVGLCLNILGTSLDGGACGTPVHVLMRLVLQRCDDLSGVEALLRGAELSASSSFNVGTPGALASFEVSPAAVERVDAVDGVLLHTNHFLRPPAGATDLYRRDWPDTQARLDELERRVRRAPGRLGADAVKDALRSHEAGQIAVCCHDADNERYADRQESLVSGCLHLEDLRFELADGAPCRTPYAQVGAGAAGAGTRQARSAG